MAEAIEPSAIVETHGLDHQRVAVPAADRMSHPGRALGVVEIAWMAASIKVDASNVVVVLEQLGEAALCLDELERHRHGQHVGKAGGKTIDRGIVRIECCGRAYRRPVLAK